MSIFTKWFSKEKAQIPNRQGSFLSGGSMPSEYTNDDFLSSYENVGWWHAVVFKIALGISEVEWTLHDVSDKTKPKEIFEHPILDLLKLVNPFQTKEEFMALDTIYMECLGESFWVLNYNRNSEPSEMILAYPSKMSIVPDKSFPFVKGYVYGNGAEAIPLDINDVIHFKYPNPSNQYRGLGQAKAIGVNLSSQRNSDLWINQFFHNSARPDGILQFDYNLSDEQFDKLKKTWAEQHQGVSKAHKIALLEGGGKYIQVQNSVKDMDFANLQTKLKDIILGVEAMPQGAMGISENVNKSNVQAGEYQFARWIVKTRLNWKRAKLQEQLLPKFKDNKNKELNFREVVPETIEEKVQLADTGIRGSILTINEARRKRGEDPIEGEVGDCLIVPANMVLVNKDGEVVYQAVQNNPLGGEPYLPEENNLNEEPQISEEELEDIDQQFRKSLKGSSGSGNYGHGGRPGEVGGSSPGGGGSGGGRGEKPSSGNKPSSSGTSGNRKPSGNKPSSEPAIDRDEYINNNVTSGQSKWDKEVLGRTQEELRNAKIPDRHLSYVKSIDCNDSKVAKLAKENGVKSYTSGVFNPKDSSITLGSSTSAVHEIGHAVIYKEVFSKARGGELLNIYGSCKKSGKGFVSDYAKQDGHEFFAESYAAYAKNPTGFSKKNPAMGKFLKSIW